jgi:oxalate decarboxylase/phosphoglucose isomerase-like protein (cupin superfamily)
MVEEPRVIVLIRPPFVDDRGEIKNLIDAPCTSVAVITSVKGAVRGNHYHKTDYHYCWLQRGGMILYQRRVGDTKPPQRWTIKSGQMFYTPPMHEHMMRFTKDSVMLVFARNNREMAHYEADTIRVAPIAR